MTGDEALLAGEEPAPGEVVEALLGDIEGTAQEARAADWALTLKLAYAHRVLSPGLSLRVLSRASGLSPSTIRARVHKPGVMDAVRAEMTARDGGDTPLPG